MLEKLVGLGLDEEDDGMALHETRWYSLDYAMEWHFNHKDEDA